METYEQLKTWELLQLRQQISTIINNRTRESLSSLGHLDLTEDENTIMVKLAKEPSNMTIQIRLEKLIWKRFPDYNRRYILTIIRQAVKEFYKNELAKDKEQTLSTSKGI